MLDERELTDLVTSIVGLSAVGAAAILAETGDLTRFPTARAVVKHAGLAPREKQSGTFTGRTKLTGQGRPGLRLAAWRGVWGTQRANPVYEARYRHLTSRDTNPLTPTQAQAAIAAAIMRHLHAVVTTGQPWDPHIATHGTKPAPTRSLRPPERRSSSGRSGRAPRGIETHCDLACNHGQPRPVVTSTRLHAAGLPTPLPLCRDDDRPGHRPNRVTQNALR